MRFFPSLPRDCMGKSAAPMPKAPITADRARRVISLVYVVLFAFSIAVYAKPARRRPTRTRSLGPQATGPTDLDAYERGLASPDVPYVSLYEGGRQYHQDVHTKRFSGPVLGYVTPWNRRGYEVAEIFRSKLTHVSPVWYQLRRQGGEFGLVGGHEHNQTWIHDLRRPPGGGEEAASFMPPKIAPRVVVELEPADMVAWVSNPQQAAEQLEGLCEANGYDGIVLEVWAAWLAINGLNNEQFRQAAFSTLEAVAGKLHASCPQRQLLLAVPPLVPPSHQRPYMDRSHYAALAPLVDGFSVMTYDYSSAGVPGPNSPLPWLHTNLQAAAAAASDAGSRVDEVFNSSKLLAGVNFYGYDFATVKNRYAPKAITADDFGELLRSCAPTVEWSEEHREHSFSCLDDKGDRHVAYYPTPAALAARVDLASEYGAGLSIWELGQGLECFMDVL